MAKTTRVKLERQQDTTSRKTETTATQAGVPEEQMEASAGNDKPTLDEIAEEAYAIYLGHGAQHGFDIDHWLEAERRLQMRKAARNRPDVAADDPKNRT